MRPTPVVALVALLAGVAIAADKPALGELPPPPEMVKGRKPATAPAPAASPINDDALEPEVVITPRGEDVHEEYRIGGRVYMIKVVPKRGKPYYLVDPDGRGEFQRSDLQPSVSPPMWVIKRF